MMITADKFQPRALATMNGSEVTSQLPQEHSSNVPADALSRLLRPITQLELEHHQNWLIHVPSGAYERIL